MPAPASDVTPARLSYLNGEVSFWRPGAQEWTPAKVNMPLAPGDLLYTGPGGNLEIQVGPRAFVRASEGTHIGLDNQEPDFVQFRLTAGHAALDVRELAAGHAVELDTPHGAFTVERTGYYHAEVTQEFTAFDTHRGGSATVTPAGGAATPVAANQQVMITGTDSPRVEMAAAPPLSAWDRWNHQRTAYLLQPVNTQNVSPSMYGTEELAQHGSWRTEETYGPVWVPASVPPGWVPYSTGRWIWDPRFGWTWLDAASWGWAPYHYGRWVFVRGYWGWAPGPIVVRPVYAPALVVFLGGPVGVAVAARPVHWAPLGWGEPVIPWWGRPGFVGVAWWGGWGGPRVVNNVVINRTTNVNVTNINAYSNVHVHNAVVGVSEDRFGRGSMQTVRVDDARVRELRPVRGALDVKPVAASVMSADRAASQPPAAIRDRNVVATRTPRDFSPTLRAQGLGAERETPPSAPSRIVPAPKRTTTATPPSEGPSSSPRPRPAETPNVRRPDPSAAPNPGAGVPRPGRREGASGQPDSGQPDSRQGKRPQADENERGRRSGPPPPPPAHNSAESRQLQPQGPEQRRRPEAKPAQPPQRSNERPPERTEPRQQEK
ncbi:MAG: hypothetical protein DME10_09885 [Candidatus Rokuibacteriota bacterium]|nr:MAG: hypothetical protein DME10_09885 [Candidatus Rokubacteria bacterium]